MKKCLFIRLLYLSTLFSLNAFGTDINQDYQFFPSKSSLTPQEHETKNSALNYAKFWNTGNEDFLTLALHDDFTDKNLPEGRIQGIEGPKDASLFFRKVVPDLTCTIEALYIIEDRAIVRYRFQGHFSGTFDEKQGKSQVIDFSAVDMYKVTSGKIIENWHLEDNLTLMKQFEAISFN